MSTRDRNGNPTKQRQRTASARATDPRVQHVIPNGLTPAMPADVLAAVLNRGAQPAPTTGPEAAAPEPESIGRARARAMRSSWRIECSKCGKWIDAPSSKAIRQPRCVVCGPAPTRRKRKAKPQPQPEYELQ